MRRCGVILVLRTRGALYFGTPVRLWREIRNVDRNKRIRAEGILFKAIIVNSAHFSAGRNSRINRVTDHKQKRACGPAAPIILDCIIAPSDARIASRAILFPLSTVVFQLGGSFFSCTAGGEIKPCLILFKVRFRLVRATIQ